MDTQLSKVINLILKRFFPELTYNERLYGFFQKDNALTHTDRNLMAVTSNVSGQRVISAGLRSAHCPDLSCHVTFICAIA
jgi:hypothetical protein